MTYLTTEIRALIHNLLSGLQLLFFRSTVLKAFDVGIDKAIFILIFNFILYITVNYFEKLPDPAFNSFAIPGFALQVLGLLITAIIIAKSKKDSKLVLAVVIQFSSVDPIIYIAWITTSRLIPTEYYLAVYLLFLLWAMLIVGFIIFHHLDRMIKKVIIPLVCYILLTILPALLIPSGDFWYEQLVDKGESKELVALNQEEIFYDQFDYLNTIKQTLLRNQPNVQDLYFLGFGSYAREDVFMKEIVYIQKLMDEKFNTSGRSVGLINNLDTTDNYPLASKSNFERVLKIMGESMDTNEDVLFLYLTSHGSKKPELSVSFWPLKLNNLNPRDVKSALDNAGIKWRIILVSACYSGGFIDVLKNENTLILTASAFDRTSFGCGSKSDFTYFGEAVFKKQLNHHFSFIPAFENAVKSIEEREKKEGLTHSLPQLFIGKNMENKIKKLEKELSKNKIHSRTGS